MKYPGSIRKKDYPHLTDSELKDLRNRAKAQRKGVVILQLWAGIVKCLAGVLAFYALLFLLFIGFR
jgi:hypothetical protein